MFKVVLMFSFIIIVILAELALDTILLLRQVVFCTYTLFGTLNIPYGYVRVVFALDFRSDGRGFDSHHRWSYFVCDRYLFFFFLITIFMIFFPS